MHLLRLITIAFTILFSGASYSAASEHSPMELRKLAEQYEHGRNVQHNYLKAFQLYCMATLRGDALSSYQLGWMYFNGRGVEKDHALAAGWFAKAANGGDTHAIKMLEFLSGYTPKEDHNCSLSNPSKQQIHQWVEFWAPHYALDHKLVLAVISAESNFNPKAKSHKGAMGLMQLIPGTAQRFGVQDAYNPVDNMHGGMAYLKWLLNHFDGNLKYALAGYNAGEGAVTKYKGIPPYRETRHYVQKIVKNYIGNDLSVQN